MSSFSEMEWNGKWDWDDLGMFNSKASEGLKKLQVEDWENEDGGEIDGGDLAHGGSSGKSSMSASTDSSPKKGIKTSGFNFEAFGSSSGAIIKKMEPRADLSGISSPLEDSVVSVEPPTGLKLGFENSCTMTNTKRPSSVVAVSSSASVKKTKSTSQNTSIPCCQVQGCNLDLSSAKDYHRKNRVCESHSKCPKVTVGGIERRFCQQCSRFHSLSEFDEKKRSCRRRLSDHNARRRKPRQETIQFHPAKLSSLFYDGRQQMNFALNNTKGAGNSTWESATRSMFKLTKDFPLKSEKTWQPSMSGVHLPYTISMHSNSSSSISACKGPSAKVFTQGTKETTFSSNLDSAPEFPRALSLLSTNSWVSYEPESIPHDHRLPANPTSMSPPPAMHTIPQGLPLTSSEYWQTEQQSTSPNFQNCSTNSGGLPQGIRLFKPDYLGLYSNALN